MVEVDESEARTLLRLIEALDDHDDVDEVHANFDISGGDPRGAGGVEPAGARCRVPVGEAPLTSAAGRFEDWRGG